MAENILAAACESETRNAAKRMRLDVYQATVNVLGAGVCESAQQKFGNVQESLCIINAKLHNINCYKCLIGWACRCWQAQLEGPGLCGPIRVLHFQCSFCPRPALHQWRPQLQPAGIWDSWQQPAELWCCTNQWWGGLISACNTVYLKHIPMHCFTLHYIKLQYHITYFPILVSTIIQWKLSEWWCSLDLYTGDTSCSLMHFLYPVFLNSSHYVSPGPTDLSMKSVVPNSSSSSSNSHGQGGGGGGASAQLSPPEVTAVRQLIAGYRESAAFLLRSADELENLILQQNWVRAKPCQDPLLACPSLSLSVTHVWADFQTQRHKCTRVILQRIEGPVGMVLSLIPTCLCIWTGRNISQVEKMFIYAFSSLWP